MQLKPDRQALGMSNAPYVDLFDKLIREVEKEPGLDGKTWVLWNIDILTWAQLGELTPEAWRDLEPKIPQKRLGHNDLFDKTRLGPGHMTSLNKVYERARNDFLQDLTHRSRSRSCRSLAHRSRSR